MAEIINFTWYQKPAAPSVLRTNFTWGTPSIVLEWGATSDPYVPAAGTISFTWGTPQHIFTWEGQTPYTFAYPISFTWRPANDCARNFTTGTAFTRPACNHTDFVLDYKGVVVTAAINIQPSVSATGFFELNAFNADGNATIQVTADAVARRGTNVVGIPTISCTVSGKVEHVAVLSIDGCINLDEYNGNVVSLLRLNESFNDDLGKTVTYADNVSISTGNYKSAPASAYFPSGYGHFKIADNGDFSFAGDYTIEFWCTTMSGCPISNSAFSYIYSGNVWINNTVVISGLTWTTGGTWRHIALTRSGDTLRVFENGVLKGSGTKTGTHNWTNMVFGRYEPNGNSGVNYNGYIDDVRVTRGVARYTTKFGPAEYPLVDIFKAHAYNKTQIFQGTVIDAPKIDDTSNILALNFFENETTDFKGKTYSISGAARLDPPSTLPKKLRLDGTTGYASYPYDAAFEICGHTSPVGPVTLEMWFTEDVDGSSGALYSHFRYDYNWGFHLFPNGFYAILGGVGQNPTWSAPSKGVEHHIAVVRASLSSLKIYLDGILVYSKTDIGSMYSPSSAAIYIGNKSNLSSPFKGTIDNFRFSLFEKYTSNFIPDVSHHYPYAYNEESFINFELIDGAVTYDNSSSNVKFMLSMNGEPASTNVIDEKGRAITNSGATISYSKLMEGSPTLYFNGSTRLSTSYASFFNYWGTGDYSLEMWIWPESLAGGLLANVSAIGGSARWWSMSLNSNGTLAMYSYSGGINASTSTTSVVALNQWNHIAVTRSSGTVRIFVNGVSVWSGSPSNVGGTHPWLDIGAYAGTYFTGYMEDFRVSDVARYTSNFTPVYKYSSIKVFEPYQYNSSIVDQANYITDTWEIYNIQDIILLRAEYTPSFINESELYTPAAFNRQEYYTISGVINSSELYNIQQMYNTRQVISSLLVDDASVYQIASAFNWVQYISQSALVDSSSTYNPYAFNWIQYTNQSALVDSSSTYNPTIVMMTQIIIPSFVDAVLLYNPTIVVMTQIITPSALIDSSSITNIVSITLTKTIVSTNIIDTGNVYDPFASTLIRYYTPSFVEAGSINNISSLFNRKQIITPTVGDSASTWTFGVSLAWIDVHPTLIDAFSISNPTVITLNTYITPTLSVDESTTYPPLDVTHLNREFHVNVVQSGESFEPTVYNMNSVLYPFIVNDSSIYSIDSWNKNFSINVSGVINESSIPTDYVLNVLNQIITPSVIDDSSTNTFDFTNWVRYYEPTLAETVSLFNPTINIAPAASMDGPAYDGQSMVTDVTTNANHRLFAFAYNGENFDVVLTDNPFAQFAPVAYNGSALVVDYMSDVFPGISNVIMNDGWNMPNLSLTSDPLIFAYDGSNYSVDGLSTDSTFEGVGAVGEAFIATITPRPSEGLTLEAARSSESMQSEVFLLFAGQEFFPYAITDHLRVLESNFEIPFYLDLPYDCKCGKPRPSLWSNVNIEMDNECDLFEKFDGGASYMFVELQVNRRMEAVAWEGVNFYTRDSLTFLLEPMGMDLGEGSCVTIDGPILRHKLCRGNFRPTGSNFPLELIDVLGDDCEDYVIRTSEIMRSVLSLNSRLYPLGYDGSYMVGDVTILPPMSMAAYNGSYMQVYIEHDYVAAFGSYMKVTMYEEAYQAWVGECMEAVVTSEYGVEFLEAGTLMNEYVYQYETGEINWDKTTNVPMEMRIYQHDLKARCF